MPYYPPQQNQFTDSEAQLLAKLAQEVSSSIDGTVVAVMSPNTAPPDGHAVIGRLGVVGAGGSLSSSRLGTVRWN